MRQPDYKREKPQISQIEEELSADWADRADFQSDMTLLKSAQSA
jgi:hypothetical protein